MKPIIYSTFYKRDNTLYQVNTLFPSFVILRKNEEANSPYKVENTSSASILTSFAHLDIHPVITDEFIGFNNVDGIVKPVDDFDKIVITIHHKDTIEEILCSQVVLQQKKARYTDGHIIFESELSITPVIEDKDYNLRYDKAISLNSDCKIIEVSSYFPPRAIPFDKTSWNLKPSFYPCINSYYGDYQHGNLGIRTTIDDLIIEQIPNQKIILIQKSICVQSREYTVISHSSMDPGPDEVSEWTDWNIKLCVQFSLQSELDKYLSKLGVTKMDNDNSLSKNGRYYRLHFDSPKSIKEIESFIGYKFIETWTTNSVRS